MNRRQEPWLVTRHTLLERLKDKADDRSWQEFFDLYGRLIYSVACQAGLSHVESEEVVQETILYVSKKIEKFKATRAAGSFKAWLRRLIQWRIRDQIRRRRPEDVQRDHRRSTSSGQPASSTATEERIPDPSAGDFQAVWDQEWREHVREKALELLRTTVNPKHYQIFQMHVLENQPVKTVAAAFGITEAQVYLIKHRVLESLKEHSEQLQERIL